MNQTTSFTPRTLPWVRRDTLLAVCSLGVFGLLTAILARVSLPLGILTAIVGTAVNAVFFYRRFHRLIKTNMELDRACRTRLLEKYLSGDIPPVGDLTEAMPGLPSEYFAVGMVQCIDFSGYLPQCGDVHIPPTEFLRVDLWMRDSISRHVESICTPYFVPMTDGIIVIFSIKGIREAELDESSREKAEEICQGLAAAIEDLKSHGLICGAVVSTVYYGRENIVRAHREADELTAYAELMGDSSTVKNGYSHAEAPMELSDKLLRTELEKRFMQSLTNRNFPQLEDTMGSFIDLELHTSARYPDLVKLHIVSHMEQMLSAFSVSPTEYDEAEAPVVQEYRTLMQMTSARQLRDQCFRLIAALRQFVESGVREHSDKVDRALRFIEENYANPGICADLIGDALGLSASYVSRLLRQNTGMGVVDYIHAARLKKAKELLATTDLSVDDIALQVGFSSRWTLTRSFKRYEETTPGAYREQNHRVSAS